MSERGSWWVPALSAAVLMVSPVLLADDGRGGEFGVMVGAIAAEDVLTGDSGSVDPSVGLRGGSVFARHWGWFLDGVYAEISTEGPLGDARTVSGRTGFELLFTPERNARFFVSLGAGWMVTDFENSALRDFHRPLAALGFGQRIRVGANKHVRWEIRGDVTLDDARLGGEDLAFGHALLGFTWGPGTKDVRRDAAGRHRAARDESGDDRDGDGVRNKRDGCPRTPAGVRVDAAGCPLDSDGDGVFDGIDLCPRSPRGETVNSVGCPDDEDGDGVPDSADVCANTPENVRVDEWGCPKDSDGDGVPNGLDRCPSTPVGAVVDPTGCPRDGDRDGVYDGIDRCPDSKAGVPVNASGCPADGDGDGVHDGIDRCPDTPPEVEVVDADGCARAAEVFDPGESTVVLRGVNFDHDGVRLTGLSRQILDRVATSLSASPGFRVEIAGHTDSLGKDAYNTWLSTRRAEVVRDYLVGHGVDAGRLVVRGYGESRPLGDNSTEAGRAMNRRVELTKLD